MRGLLAISLVVFLFFFFIFSLFQRPTEEYILTKALCEDTTCRDYKITCNEGRVISMTPLTGFVTFPTDWEDTREKKELCAP